MLEGPYKRVISARLTTRIVYYGWVATPYFLRKPMTAVALVSILLMKKLFGVNRRDTMTPAARLGTLSFWGVPQVSVADYRLRVHGKVERPLALDLEDLLEMPSVERPIRMDCVGGFRNNTVMKGVPLGLVLAEARPQASAESAIFTCADEYHTTHLLTDLAAADALLVYETNGERIARFGSPLRLAVPGTYGYKWAKWVGSIELTEGFPPGHWERLGLPKRGRIGDIW